MRRYKGRASRGSGVREEKRAKAGSDNVNMYDWNNDQHEETLMGTARKLRDVAQIKRRLERNRSHHFSQKRGMGGSNSPLRLSFCQQSHGRFGHRHVTSSRFGVDVNAHFPDDLRGDNQASSQFSTPFETILAQRAGDSSSSMPPSKGGFLHTNHSREDPLLFRLIVVLQLCQVRIEDADRILCGRRRAELRSQEMVERKINENHEQSTSTIEVNNAPADLPQLNPHHRSSSKAKLIGISIAGMGAATILGRRYKDPEERRDLLFTAGKTVASVTALMTVRRGWVLLGMSARLAHSATALEDWQHQWVIVNTGASTEATEGDDEDSAAAEGFAWQAGGDLPSSQVGGSDNGSTRLLELIESQGTTTSVWHCSYGAVRFMLIKRAMDTLYASVGAAMSWVEKQERLSRFWMPIATAAAASYYTVTGPGTKSAEVVSSSSPDFIKKAWGVVSLPAVKHLSLQASRILKGAAIAERITIADVPCIVMSRNSCPPLATAFKRFWRQQERETSHLSTIMESSRHLGSRQRAVNVQDYPEKDVILHLTGGGFFAHTIAGDLPYLLDWSGATNAVVICPEYALLPEHCFPVAIDQICTIYCSLLSGDAAPLLGFRTDKVIITGEAVGGNLAAALCVKLCVDQIVNVHAMQAKRQFGKTQDLEESFSSIEEGPSEALQHKAADEEITKMASPAGGPQCEYEEDQDFAIRLPDAMMLCCPALNMSLELSPSRVRGTNDPVLPRGLIRAISDGYLPPGKGLDKTDPVASPYYAPDDILRVFPPTLLCESTEDPLLDDTVSFNSRLRNLGVESDLRAAHNMPHAFWGLITAGFPEAKQVHLDCQEWLRQQFQRGCLGEMHD